MESDLRPATIADAQSGVSWAAIAAGAVATAALTLLLVSFGAGLGLSAISPWSDSGVSASTFKVGTGIYLIIIGVMSSAVGGYLAGRLRTKWVGVHTDEVFFRDTAHGFLAWAFATLISATALGPTTAYLANGDGGWNWRRVAQAAHSTDPSEIYVDKLFRTAPTPHLRPSTQPIAIPQLQAAPSLARQQFQLCAAPKFALVDRRLSQRGRPRFNRQSLSCASCCRAHGHQPGGCRQAGRLRRE